TAWDALEEEAGHPGVMTEINRKNSIAVLTPEDAFHVYIVSDKFLGWEIEDDISLPLDEEDPYTIHRTEMVLHKNKQLDTIMVVTQDRKLAMWRLLMRMAMNMSRIDRRMKMRICIIYGMKMDLMTI